MNADFISNILIPAFLSLKVAGLATLIALFWGGLFAWLLFGRHSIWSALMESAISLPLVLPPTVMGFYLLTILGRTGPLGKFLNDTFRIELIFTPAAAVIAASVAAVPIVYKSCKAFFEAAPIEVIEAARLDGASELRIFSQVRLPLAAKGVIAGVSLAFLRAIGEFGATFMVAGNIPGRTQTLSLSIWGAVMSGNLVKAHLIAVLLVVLSLAVTGLIQILDRQVENRDLLPLKKRNLAIWEKA